MFNSDLEAIEKMLKQEKQEAKPYTSENPPQTPEAINQVIIFYLPLIVKILKKFFVPQNYRLRHHIGIDDLFQEAVLLLMHVIKNYKQIHSGSDFERHLVYCSIKYLHRFINRHNRLTTLDHEKSNGSHYEDILNFRDEENIEMEKLIFKKTFDDWALSLRQKKNGNYEKLKEILAKSGLSEIEAKILDFRHGLSGIVYTWPEIAVLTDCSKETARIYYDGALRKIISMVKTADSFDIAEYKRRWGEIIADINYYSDIVLTYYNFSDNSASRTPQENLRKFAERKRKIIRNFRKKILEHKEAPKLLAETRQWLFSLLNTINLKPEAIKVLSEFYCLDGTWRNYKETSGKSFFFLWKVQQKFKASLSSVVGLMELSRDLAFTNTVKQKRRK